MVCQLINNGSFFFVYIDKKADHVRKIFHSLLFKLYLSSKWVVLEKGCDELYGVSPHLTRLVLQSAYS